MDFKRLDDVGTQQCKALVEKYIANGKVLDDEFGKVILDISRWQAIRMRLKLPHADYEDAVMAGVFNIIKYGLKNIEQKQLDRIYFYLNFAAHSGICRFLERYNRHKKRFVATEDPHLMAETANQKDGEVKVPRRGDY